MREERAFFPQASLERDAEILQAEHRGARRRNRSVTRLRWTQSRHLRPRTTLGTSSRGSIGDPPGVPCHFSSVDVGAAGRLWLVDPDAAVRRSRRQGVHGVDHKTAGAFVAAVVDLRRHLAETGAGADLVGVALRACGVVVRDLALADADERCAWMRMPSGRAARRNRRG